MNPVSAPLSLAPRLVLPAFTYLKPLQISSQTSSSTLNPPKLHALSRLFHTQKVLPRSPVVMAIHLPMTTPVNTQTILVMTLTQKYLPPLVIPPLIRQLNRR